jgi:hypothetical protein
MTETAHPEPSPPPLVGASRKATVLAADIRRGEWGSPIPATLMRDFIHSALRHSAAADMVSEYVFDIATSDEEPPADIGEALRVAIDEVLSAATREDWSQVGRDLLTDALDTVREDPPLATPPPETPTARWPLAASGVRRRKPPVIVRQETILDWLTEVRSATLREIAQHVGCSQHSARMKADGLVAQGKLDVKPGTRAQSGRPAMPRSYTVPQPDANLDSGPAVACEEGPQHRLELPAGSS